MNRILFGLIGIVVIFVARTLQAQAALEIRAAATTPVAGWQQMASPGQDRMVWVAPTNRLTSVDIERAEASARPDGAPAVTVVFTDEGAKKMAELSAAHLNEPIAILLDGKLIWAPVVRGGMQKEALLTGGPQGLRPEEIQRLLAIFKR